MQVSAISSIPYGTYSNSQSWYVNAKGNDAETASDINTPDDIDCADCKLYSNINQWQHFCHRQIAAGNLDIIA